MSTALSIETVSELEKKVSFSIPAAEVNEHTETELNRLAQQGKFKGFRQGKTPIDLVRRTHGKDVWRDVSSRLVFARLETLVQENKFTLAAYPEVEGLNLDEGKDIAVTATLHLYPEITPKEYTSIDVTVPKRTPDDTEIEKALDNIREGKVTFKKNEFRTTVKEGDAVDVTLSVSVDGKEMGKPETAPVELGKGILPSEVEKATIGQEAGSKKTTTISYPADSSDKRFAGKTVEYTLTVNQVMDKVLPEIDDAFAKSLGLSDISTALELRMKVRERITEDAKEAEKEEVRAAIIKRLIDDHVFEVPKPLIDEEIRSFLSRMNIVAPEGRDASKLIPADMREKLEPMARERARGRIVVDKMCDAQKIEVAEADLKDWLMKAVMSGSMKPDDVKNITKNERALTSVAREIRRTKLLDLLATRANVSYSAPVVEDAAK